MASGSSQYCTLCGPPGELCFLVSGVDGVADAFWFPSAAGAVMEGLVPNRRGELPVGDDVGVAPEGDAKKYLARSYCRNSRYDWVLEQNTRRGAYSGEHTAGGEDADRSVEGLLGMDTIVDSRPVFSTSWCGARGPFCRNRSHSNEEMKG